MESPTGIKQLSELGPPRDFLLSHLQLGSEIDGNMRWMTITTIDSPSFLHRCNDSIYRGSDGSFLSRRDRFPASVMALYTPWEWWLFHTGVPTCYTVGMTVLLHQYNGSLHCGSDCSFLCLNNSSLHIGCDGSILRRPVRRSTPLAHWLSTHVPLEMSVQTVLTSFRTWWW